MTKRQSPDGIPLTNHHLSPRERFDLKWEPCPTTGCWLWLDKVDRYGYGLMCVKRKYQKAHRLAWTFFFGPIPEGMWIDHMCRVRSCCNPDHLRVVTPRTNAIENNGSPCALNRLKKLCKNGHEFSTTNTWVDRKGHRKCRTCMRSDSRKSYAQYRAKETR